MESLLIKHKKCGYQGWIPLLAWAGKCPKCGEFGAFVAEHHHSVPQVLKGGKSDQRK